MNHPHSCLRTLSNTSTDASKNTSPRETPRAVDTASPPWSGTQFETPIAIIDYVENQRHRNGSASLLFQGKARPPTAARRGGSGDGKDGKGLGLRYVLNLDSNYSKPHRPTQPPMYTTACTHTFFAIALVAHTDATMLAQASSGWASDDPKAPTETVRIRLRGLGELFESMAAPAPGGVRCRLARSQVGTIDLVIAHTALWIDIYLPLSSHITPAVSSPFHPSWCWLSPWMIDNSDTFGIDRRTEEGTPCDRMK